MAISGVNGTHVGLESRFLGIRRLAQRRLYDVHRRKDVLLLLLVLGLERVVLRCARVELLLGRRDVDGNCKGARGLGKC